ncbi:MULTISPECIES: LysM peptidoglycan-binding domain-containing protein [unclassified Micromonospora]|uniref:LysM peptidoglycan-binding domain-containing protein n=1 Tax=unclassified Micromonospora TaxID=2617518 RepID=UPI00332AF56D
MAASGRSAVRRTGRILTGFGALVVLCAVLVGAPVALLALAGNPLPDHLPTVGEIGATLTSRDDGRLFLRALALAGWFGWATFAFSVLVELCAQALRRPAPRLPGMSRQQRAAAALVGSVALIIATSPAASAATAFAGPYALPAAPIAEAPMAVTPQATWPASAAPVVQAGPALPAARAAHVDLAAQAAHAAPAAQAGQAASAAQPVPAASADGAAVYRVARGDHLGRVAERYLDDFGDYRELAALNRIDDPDRIHPGQLLRLPQEAEDRGARRHATGRLVARPTPPAPAPQPAPEQVAPDRATPPPTAEAPAPPATGAPGDQAPTVTVGAARAGDPDRVNRPLAVSAVLAVASIVGAQIGAVLGLRRRPTRVPAGAARLATPARRSTGGTGTGRSRRGTGFWGTGTATDTDGNGEAGTSGRVAGARGRAHADADRDVPIGRHRRH